MASTMDGYISAFMLWLYINLSFCADLPNKGGRLLGGGGFGTDIESYDCPCGCTINSIQGSGATQFLAPDQRCNHNNIPPTNIAGHNAVCPCGCTIMTNTNTSVTIQSNKVCDSSDKATIDGVSLNCPCGCNGTTSLMSTYLIKPSIRCSMGTSVPIMPMEKPTQEQQDSNHVVSVVNNEPVVENQPQLANLIEDTDDAVSENKVKQDNVTKTKDDTTKGPSSLADSDKVKEHSLSGVSDSVAFKITDSNNRVITQHISHSTAQKVIAALSMMDD